MAQKATRYKRIIFQSNGITVVPIGRGGRQDCTTLPDDAAELRRLIAAGPNSGGDVLLRGQFKQRGGIAPLKTRG